MEFKRYIKEGLAGDLKAGFITAIVALPLAIAFAIASGVNPVYGIYTAIIAGILGSAIGGSRYSITGPTGAMAVIILSTLNKNGLEGLLLAGFLAGIFQILFGVLRFGKFVKFIPIPIIAGFTAGIGILIFLGQLNNFLGLILPAQENVFSSIWESLHNLSGVNILAISISLFTILVLVFYPRFFKRVKYLKDVPPSIIALLASTIAVAVFSLSVPTVGVIPRSLPKINWLNFNLQLVEAVLPASFTIALLGSIEALLCAVVADGMTSTKHSSNKELVGQGIANVVLPFFGGIPATAAIARTAVNIREGAKTRMAGIYHALILLAIMLFLAPLALFIPKAFLAGVLMVVSLRMINIGEIKTIYYTGKLELLTFLLTLILTVVTNLVLAVQIGMLFAIFLLFYRLTSIISIKNMEEYDSKGEINSLLNSDKFLKENVSIYTIHGPFFFGAMNIFEQKIKEHINMQKPVIIIRMKHVPFVDGTGEIQLINFIKSRKSKNGRVLFTEFWPGVKEKLMKNKEFNSLISKEDIFSSVEKALSHLKS